MIDTNFLKHLDRLSLIINKRVTSNYSGERKSHFQGHGLIFRDYIMYSPGEDFRSIDWKVFGRSDKLFVKRYEEERNLTVHIVLDYSASMNFKSKNLKKSEYAAMMGVGFAYMALKNNERFVLSTFSDKLRVFKPRRGKRQLMLLLENLNEQKPAGHSNFEESLRKYKPLINTKSFVVIISDFLYDVRQIRNVLGRLKNHEVKLVQILDPLEVELNIEGDFKLKDLESDEQLRTYVSTYMRKNYLQRLTSHNADIKKACDEIGAEFYSFSTDKPIFDSFVDVCLAEHEHRT